MAIELVKDAAIFVAGHRGLVGSAILRALGKEGFTNILTAAREQLDLRDQAAVNYWFKANRPEFIFLVAGTVGGIWANATRPAEFIYDNMMIHATVVHAAYLYGVTKLLYLGSSCIYPRDCPQPMREEYLMTGNLEPTNEPYAIAKIAGIKLCQSYRKQYGCNFISGMPTNLYGPNDNFDLINSHVLPALIRKFHIAKLAAHGDWEGIQRDESLFGPIPDDLRASLGISNHLNQSNIADQPNNPIYQREKTVTKEQIAGPKVIIWGTGSPRREFLHVDELADACLFLMSFYEPNQTNRTDHINIGIGEDLTIKELAEMVRDIVHPEANIIFDHSKPDGPPQKLMDTSKCKQLGWSPKINLREGIKTTYTWYISQTQPSSCIKKWPV